MVNHTPKNMAKRLTQKPQDLTPRERKAYLTLFLEQNRGRPPYNFVRRASQPTGRIVRPLSKKFGNNTAGLSRNWPEIVGERYAKLSRPQRIQGGKNGNSLLIIARGPAATLLSANAANILEKVNQFLGTQGEREIARLKITQGEIALDSQAHLTKNARRGQKPPAPKAPKRGLTPSEDVTLRAGLENVKSDRLKQALEKLGRGVISRNSP